MTLDSCVKPLMASNSSGETCCLATTPWMMPLPSRKIGKMSLPLARRLYSQPRMVTVWPSWCPISRIVLMTGASVSVGLDEFMGLYSSMPFDGEKHHFISESHGTHRDLFHHRGTEVRSVEVFGPLFHGGVILSGVRPILACGVEEPLCIRRCLVSGHG